MLINEILIIIIEGKAINDFLDSQVAKARGEEIR